MDSAWRNEFVDTRPPHRHEDDCYDDGLFQGFNEGYDQGFNQGFEEGKSSVLQELIEAKQTIKKLERKRNALLNRNAGKTALTPTKE